MNTLSMANRADTRAAPAVTSGKCLSQNWCHTCVAVRSSAIRRRRRRRVRHSCVDRQTQATVDLYSTTQQ